MDINFGFAILLTTAAGLATGIGSMIAFFIRRPRYSYLSFLLGFSAGVMLYISFVELLSTAINEVGFLKANIAFFIGIAVFAAIDILIPHSYEEEYADDPRLGFLKKPSKSKVVKAPLSTLKRSAIFIAIGIAIHNFPEGMITFASAATGDVSMGIMIAVAVAMHNIPEGIAVSVPIFYATGSRRQAFIYSFLSGIAEPIGALVGYLLLLPFLTPDILSLTLGFVAGIMVYISLDELLPMAHRYGRAHLVIIGVVIGMGIMALSLGLWG